MGCFDTFVGKIECPHCKELTRFDENDVHDVKLLCETFHIEVPNEYR